MNLAVASTLLLKFNMVDRYGCNRSESSKFRKYIFKLNPLHLLYSYSSGFISVREEFRILLFRA